MFKKFAALFAFFGITSATAEETPHGVLLKEEDLTKMQGMQQQLETANADLKSANQNLATAKTDLATATAAKEKAEGELATAKTTIEAKDKEIETLTAKVTGKPVNDKKPLGSGTEDAAANATFKEKSAGFEHNQEADKVLASMGVTGTGTWPPTKKKVESED